jgi:hypothetical protein
LERFKVPTEDVDTSVPVGYGYQKPRARRRRLRPSITTEVNFVGEAGITILEALYVLLNVLGGK